MGAAIHDCSVIPTPYSLLPTPYSHYSSVLELERDLEPLTVRLHLAVRDGHILLADLCYAPLRISANASTFGDRTPLRQMSSVAIRF